MKEVIILRGVPGSGKTTISTLIKRLGGTGMVSVVSADHYFERLGFFDPAALGYAHRECQLAFVEALNQEVPIVVVDNTNTTEDETFAYSAEAKLKGYRVHSIVVENRHAGKSIHAVPEKTVQKMRDRLSKGLIL